MNTRDLMVFDGTAFDGDRLMPNTPTQRKAVPHAADTCLCGQGDNGPDRARRTGAPRRIAPRRARSRLVRTRPRRAFSLIELLLVLVILATLAAIVVPKFTGRSRQARITAAQTDIARLETALDAFETDVGRFPTEDEGLQALYEQPADVRNWQGYLKKGVPTDPWGNPYVYVQPGKNNETGYDLYSPGPNGQAGDDDDITNWNIE